MLRAIILLFLGVITISPARADSFRNANEIMDDCKHEEVDSSFNSGYCVGFITGIADAQAALAEAKLANRMVCFPKGVSAGQLVKIFERYMSQHPAELHYTAASEILISLRMAFPCKS